MLRASPAELRACLPMISLVLLAVRYLIVRLRNWFGGCELGWLLVLEIDFVG